MVLDVSPRYCEDNKGHTDRRFVNTKEIYALFYSDFLFTDGGVQFFFSFQVPTTPPPTTTLATTTLTPYEGCVYQTSGSREPSPVIVEDFNGLIASPGYPSAFPSNVKCKWIIRKPSSSTGNHLLMIAFTSITLTSGACEHKLTLNFPSISNMEFCGTNLPPSERIMVDSDSVEITLMTNEKLPKFHFRLFFDFILITTLKTSTTTELTTTTLPTTTELTTTTLPTTTELTTTTLPTTTELTTETLSTTEFPSTTLPTTTKLSSTTLPILIESTTISLSSTTPLSSISTATKRQTTEQEATPQSTNELRPTDSTSQHPLTSPQSATTTNLVTRVSPWPNITAVTSDQANTKSSVPPDATVSSPTDSPINGTKTGQLISPSSFTESPEMLTIVVIFTLLVAGITILVILQFLSRRRRRNRRISEMNADKILLKDMRNQNSDSAYLTSAPKLIEVNGAANLLKNSEMPGMSTPPLSNTPQLFTISSSPVAPPGVPETISSAVYTSGVNDTSPRFKQDISTIEDGESNIKSAVGFHANPDQNHVVGHKETVAGIQNPGAHSVASVSGQISNHAPGLNQAKTSISNIVDDAADSKLTNDSIAKENVSTPWNSGTYHPSADNVANVLNSGTHPPGTKNATTALNGGAHTHGPENATIPSNGGAHAAGSVNTTTMWNGGTYPPGAEDQNNYSSVEKGATRANNSDASKGIGSGTTSYGSPQKRGWVPKPTFSSTDGMQVNEMTRRPSVPPPKGSLIGRRFSTGLSDESGRRVSFNQRTSITSLSFKDFSGGVWVP